jgi:F0F1-type ATP synthase membrane subunit b/b'
MADMNTDLERIQKKLQEVEALQKRNKTTSTLSSIAIVVVALVMVAIVGKPLLTIYNNRDGMQKRFVAKIEERVVPKAQDEVQALIKTVVPKYQEEAQKVLDKRQGEIVDKVTKEYNTLYENLSIEITAQLDKFLKDFSERQYAMLLEEFPELTKMDETPDPNHPDLKRSEMIALAVQGATTRLSSEIFAKHIQALNKMDVEFNMIEVPDNIKGMTNEELKSLVGNEAVQYVVDKIDADTTEEVK